MINEQVKIKYIAPKAEKSKKIGIIIPFRDTTPNKVRTKQLKEFIPHITKFAKLSKNKFVLYIIEQSKDNTRFNRGKLINVGYEKAKKDKCDWIIMHDVDILPSQSLLSYYETYPTDPIHIAHLWKYYDYESYFGGIVSINIKQFKDTNGFPNTFEGWGKEDDAFFTRLMRTTNQIILRPRPRSGTFKDLDTHAYTPDDANPKGKEQLRHDRKGDNYKKNGLSNLKYTIKKTTNPRKNVTRIIVKL
jgi:predicted glycosyltransferase involved in capsule biosynthesis